MMVGDTVVDMQSGMQLRSVSSDELSDDSAWISGWFRNKADSLVIQKFLVLDAGAPTYKLASQAVDFWGEQALSVCGAEAIEMSPAFGTMLLLTAVRLNIA